MEFASDLRRQKRTEELRQRVRGHGSESSPINPLGQDKLPRRLPFATSTPPSGSTHHFYGQQNTSR